MSTNKPAVDPRKRACLEIFGLGWLALLMGCQPRGSHDGPTPLPPLIPHGQPINVFETPASVEFDFRVKDEGLYDFVLEVFEKGRRENTPVSRININDAHFNLRVDRISEPVQTVLEGEVIERLEPISYGRSTNDYRERGLLESLLIMLTKPDPYDGLQFPMSTKRGLLLPRRLTVGHYRLRAEFLKSLSQLEGRLVQISVMRSRTKH